MKRTIPEILLEAILEIRNTHGVVIESVSVEWQKIHETGTRWPYAEPTDIIFRGTPTDPQEEGEG